MIAPTPMTNRLNNPRHWIKLDSEVTELIDFVRHSFSKCSQNLEIMTKTYDASTETNQTQEILQHCYHIDQIDQVSNSTIPHTIIKIL